MSAPSQGNMKRSSDIKDPSDRAQKRRRPDLRRVLLRQIGFSPFNRGGLGISPFHVHEVCHDCLSNGVKITRYHHVYLVEIPRDRLEEIREVNRQRCAEELLMPAFSPEMIYVCATKTHFTHAQKLAEAGHRTLFNQGQHEIVWQKDDIEGAEIMKHGVLAAIYDCKLFDDEEALAALASDDNLNAGVVMGEDEMQAFARVDALMTKAARKDETTGNEIHQSEAELMRILEVEGLSPFSTAELTNFIQLRRGLSPRLSKILRTCQFNACASRVRVRPRDFGIAARLDPRTPFGKVSLVLNQYIDSLPAELKKPGDATFSGRNEIIAKKMNRDHVKELEAEPAFVHEVERFITAMLTHYDPQELKGSAVRELLSARGELLSTCGGYMLRVGGVLNEAMRKASLRKKEVSPVERTDILEKSVHKS